MIENNKRKDHYLNEKYNYYIIFIKFINYKIF